jgi:peptidoglycan/LPS O-acetylase OafA/YrhL
MGHIPALDGIRGVAVLAVIAHHLDHLTGGYLGVDAFFVLSGFLITGLLVDEVRFGSGLDRRRPIDLGRFWVRRVKRLFPALALLVVVVVVVESWVISDDGPTLRREVLSALLYVYNWNALAEGIDYWSSFASPSPLRHMWSLAIEEQFYLFWPLLVLAVVLLVRRSSSDPLIWRHRSTAAVGVVSAVLAVLSLLVAQVVHDPSDVLRVYYGTDTRIAAILFGATAAVVVRRLPTPSARAQRVFGLVGLTLLVPLAWAWIGLDGTSTLLYRGGLVATGLGVTVVIVAAVLAPASLLTRLMSLRALRACGLVSYGLYLWHWPIIVWLDPARTGLDGLALFALRAILTVAITLASYVLVEQPVRRSNLGAGRTALFGLLALGALIAFTLVALPARSPLEQPAAGTRSTVPIPPPEPETPPRTSVVPGSTPGTAPDLATAPAAAGPTRLMVVGDSGAYFLGDELAAAGADGVIVLPRGVVGCGIANVGGGSWTVDGAFLPDPEGCEGWPTAWAADIDAFDPDQVLIVLSWPGLGDREIDGVRRHPCEPEFDEFYRERVALAVEVAGAGGAEVVVATAPYYVGPGNDATAVERVDCLNDVMTTTTTAAGGTTLDLAAWACPGGECITAVDGVTLRPDGLHFQGPGGQLAARWVLEQLAPAD